jgi:Cof subfamily protein (haloacid dehalogenase superfamily)
MIKLFVSDLDGTLFHNPEDVRDRGISPINRLAIQRLVKQGVKFMMASGRDHWFRLHLQKDLGFNIDAIGMNGCNTVIDDELISNHTMTREDVLDVIKVAHLAPVESNMLGIDSDGNHVFQYVDREPYELFYQLHKKGVFKHMSLETIHTWIQDPHHPPFNKFVGMVKNTYDRNELIKFYEEQFGSRFDLVYTGPESMEIMPKGISKGSALLELMNLKGYQAHEVATIGDSMNDVTMLQAVPWSFVMSHADDFIKQHARYEVESVAEAIEKVLKFNETES